MTAENKQLKPIRSAAKAEAMHHFGSPKHSRRTLRLQIAGEKQQVDAHLLFMKEFLAPLFTKMFLRQRSTANF